MVFMFCRRALPFRPAPMRPTPRFQIVPRWGGLSTESVLSAGLSCEMEVVFGAGYIFVDFCSEGFYARKADFFAQVVEKFQFERRFFGEFDWLEVKDVRFYAEACTFKCWAVAEAGNGLEAVTIDGNSGDVDAEGGQ